MRFSFFLFLSLSFFGLHSQAQTWAWAKSVWGTKANHVLGVETDKKGNVYITGRFMDTMYLATGTYLVASSTGYYDAFVAKYTDQGSLVWAKRFGANRDDAGNNITCDSSGNIYIAGYTRSTTALTYDSYSFTGTGNDKTFILKINPAGTLIWGKTVTAGTSNAYPTGIAVNNAGNLVMSGNFSFLNLTVDTTIIKYVLSEEVFIAMFSSANGTLKWVKGATGRFQQYASNIAVDDSGYCYTSGIYNGTVNFSSTDSLFNGVNGGNYRTFLSKHDSLGNVKWLRSYYGLYDNVCDGLVLTKSGDLCIAGWHGSGSYTMNDSTFSTSSSHYLQKVSPAGSSYWTKHFPSGSLGRIRGIATDNSNNIYLAGFAGSTFYFDTIKVVGYFGNYRNFIVKVNPAGQVLVAKDGGDKVNDAAGAGVVDNLAADYTGAAYLVGYFGNAVNDTSTYGTHKLIGKGDKDGHIVKFESGCGVNASFSLSSSPVCLGTTVQFTNSSNGALSYSWKLNDSLISKGTDTAFHFTQGGNYTVKLVAQNSTCKDSLSKVVTVNLPFAATRQLFICTGDSILIAGKYRSQAGTFIDSLKTVKGCDSLVTSNLSVNNKYSFNISRTICAGDSAFLQGKYRKTSGVYTDSFLTSVGCDSIYTTTLNVASVFSLSVMLEICDGDSLKIAGQWRKVSGSWIDSLMSVSGCDSIVTNTLTVNPGYSAGINYSICNGDSILITGKYRKLAGTFIDSLKTGKGCDSILIYNLNVYPKYSFNISSTICTGDSVYLGGKYRKTNGVYTDSLKSVLGCDSVYVTSLSVVSVFMVSVSLDICKGDSLKIAGLWRKVSGSWNDSLKSVSGCDSIVSITLTVNPVYSASSSISICKGDSILIFGKYRKLQGVYYDSLKTTPGCDSLLSVILSVNNLPVVSYTGLNNFYCLNAAQATLTGFPTGGTFTGPGISGNIFIPVTAGTGFHSIVYTYADNNACIASIGKQTEVAVCTGIENNQRGVELNIMPNPGEGIFIMETDLEGEVLILLRDMTGRTVAQQVLFFEPDQKQSLDFTGIATGVYFLTISKEGKVLSRKLSIIR